MRILLASASERRGTILRQRFANVEQVALKGVDESVPRQILSTQVMEVASRKAEAVVLNDEFDVVVVSDTLVEDPDDEHAALGKPVSREQAVAMLLRLRGRRHRVGPQRWCMLWTNGIQALNTQLLISRTSRMMHWSNSSNQTLGLVKLVAMTWLA